MASTHAKSVLIVDDNAFLCEALCELFDRESDFEVCAEAENGKEEIAKAQALHPDLIVLDPSMPVMNDFDAARFLKRLMPHRAADHVQCIRRQVRRTSSPAHWNFGSGLEI